MLRHTRVVLALAAALSATAVAGAGPIRLKTATFDPLVGGEPRLDARVPAGPSLRDVADRYRLVQLDTAPTAERQRAIEARGTQVVGYVPDRTLIVRMTSGTDAGLRSEAGVRWVGRFAPGYKLAGGLLGSAEDGVVAIRIFLFRGEDPGPLAAALRAVVDGAVVLFEGGGIRPRVDVEIPAARLATALGSLARDPAVQYVTRTLPLRTLNDHAVWIGQSYDRTSGPAEAGASDPKPYPQSATLWNHGLTGVGQIVAVADSGLEHAMCPFDDPGVPLVPQSVAPPGSLVLQPDHRKILALNAPLAGSYATDDSFRHGTHVAGSVAGDDPVHPAGPGAGHDHGDGMAPRARIVFEDVSGAVGGDCFTSIVVPSLTDLLEQEYRAGARISTNSWGTGGGDESLGLDADVSVFAHEDLLVLFSAGNDGGRGLNSFAAAKNALAVGATENFDPTFADAFGILDPENMAAFSSHGPTADGRLKPDVVAPGFRVDSARLPVEYVADENAPACTPAPGVCRPSFGGCYVTDLFGTCHVDGLLGTSMATPLTAGLAALARQYLVEGFHPSGAAVAADSRAPSAALVKAVLINGARNMTGRLYERREGPVDLGPLADAPSFVQGWGRVQLDDALHFAGETRRLLLHDVPNASGLTTDETLRLHLSVTSAGEPLEATLAWTDAPGQPVAGQALVNDLDLELAAPDGKAYRGNQWTADDIDLPGERESLADAPGRDSANNVEGVRLAAPSPGLYTVRLIARDVPGEGGVLTQGGALVVTGAVAECTAAAPPQNLHVQSFGGQAVALAWDSVPGALGYTVLRNGSGCRSPMPADLVVSLPAGATTFVDTGVQPSEIYNYTVRAVVSSEGCETADSACVSAIAVDAAVPLPVPDGISGSPLVVGKGLTSFGLVLRWDVATCPASAYHVLHGPLGGVADYQITGAACNPGTSGSFLWLGVPPGDLWFLVVSSSAGTIEGSWGRRSDGLPRGDGSASGHCGTLVRDEFAVCASP